MFTSIVKITKRYADSIYAREGKPDLTPYSNPSDQNATVCHSPFYYGGVQQWNVRALRRKEQEEAKDNRNMLQLANFTIYCNYKLV